MTTLKIELKGFGDVVRVLDPQIVKRATPAALNRAVKSGKTAVSSEICATWNVKKRDLDPRIAITMARAGQMQAAIVISGKSLSLSYFGARQLTRTRVLTRSGKEIKSNRITRRMRKAGPLPVGVMVQVKKGEETALYRSAFLARMKKTGHIGVFRRTGKSRLPIEEKNVVSVATMMQRPEVQERMVKRIEERWATEFTHQLEYFQGRR